MAKPKAERRPCPEAPKNFDQQTKGAKTGAYDIDSYNEEAYDSYKNKALEGCPNCGRTFNADALVRHLKMCKTPVDPSKRRGAGSPARADPVEESKGPSGGGSSGAPKEKATGGIQKPRTLMCYICGREFGSSSLEIHLKSCKTKFEAEQAKLPPGQRKETPKPPQNFD